jgi:WD40 repeat protein
MKKALGLGAALVLTFGLATNWRDLPLGALKIPAASQPQQQLPTAPATEISTASEWQTTPIQVIKAKTNGNVALSGDGHRLIAISSNDNERDTLVMYNAQTGEWMSERISEISSFAMVALNHTGSQVATITEELSTGHIQLSLLNQQLDTTLWQQTLRDRDPSGDASKSLTGSAITALAFRPGDDMILTGLFYAQILPEKTSDASEVSAFNHQVSLYRTETGKLMRSLKTAPNLMTILDQYAFSPDGNFLAALGETWPEGDFDNDRGKKTLNVWQVDNERSLLQFNRGQNAFKTLDMPDQAVEIVAASDGNVNVLNSAHSSSSFYKPSENNSLDSWDIETGEKTVLQQIVAGDSKVSGQIYLSPNGETALLLGAAVGTETQIKNLKTGQQWTLEMDESIDFYSNVVFSASGDYVAVTTPESILIYGKR